jgi:hypothetical protein
MNRLEPIALPKRLDHRVRVSIDEHIADATVARARARNPHGHRSTHRPDPGRRLMFQLAEAYVRALRASRTA